MVNEEAGDRHIIVLPDKPRLEGIRLHGSCRSRQQLLAMMGNAIAAVETVGLIEAGNNGLQHLQGHKPACLPADQRPKRPS